MFRFRTNILSRSNNALQLQNWKLSLAATNALQDGNSRMLSAKAGMSTSIPGDPLSELLTVKLSERDDAWKWSFSQHISTAKFSNGTNGSEKNILLQIVSPDGFNYATLYYPDPPWYQASDTIVSNDRFCTLDDIALRVLQNGDGIVVNHNFDTMEAAYVFSHGDILQHLQGNSLYPWIPNALSPVMNNLPQGQSVVIEKGTRMRYFQPPPEMIPQCTRDAIRGMLVTRQLPPVQICVFEHESDGIVVQELAFLTDMDDTTYASQGIPLEAMNEYLGRCLSWSFPRNTSIVIMNKSRNSSKIENSFKPL